MTRTTPLLAPVSIGLAVVALLASAGLASPGTLALSDPMGDALDGRRDMDITGLTFRVATSEHAPPVLAVSMHLVGVPATLAGSYYLQSEVGCGWVGMSYTPGRAITAVGGAGPFEFWAGGCGRDTEVHAVGGQLDGPTITWLVPMWRIPPPLRDAGRLTDIIGTTGTSDPVYGYEGNAQIEGMPVVPTDELRSSAVWRFT